MDITPHEHRVKFSVISSMCRCGAGLLLGAVCSTVVAQNLRVTPLVGVNVVATDNATLDATSRADVIVTTTPKLDFQGSDASYRFAGSLGLEATNYLGRTGSDKLLPRVNVDGTASIVDRLLFLDAGVKADVALQNPFGISGAGNSALNSTINTSERISPYIDRELGPNARLTLRTDHNWIQFYSDSGAQSGSNVYLESQNARYELRPQPMGLRAEFVRQATDYGNQSAQNVDMHTLRVAPSYAPSPQFSVSVVGGVDRARYATNDVSRTLVGAGLRWVPNERTTLEGAIERRFFGQGGNLDLTHRSPFMAFNASVSRYATTYASQLLNVPAGANVAQLLDAMLVTRIPNAVDRAAAVQQFISQRNLPSSLANNVDIYSGSAQLVQSASLSVALLGTRHALTLRVFDQKTEDLLGPNDPTPLFSGNARQRGQGLTFSRRLTPDMTADASVTHAKVTGFGATNAGLRTSNTALQLGLSHQVSLRTTATVAVRHQSIDSTTVPSARENALTAGVLHRF